jgi:integrase/recombinase XerC
MQFDSNTIEQFLGSLIMRGVSDNTVRGYRSDLKALAEFLDTYTVSLPLDTLEQVREFEEWTAKTLNSVRRDLSPATINRRLASYRAFGNWVSGKLTPPCDGFLKLYKAPTRGPGVAHPLPGGMDDIIEMYSVAYHHHHRALVVLIGMLGLRVSEARNVKVDHFDDSSGEVLLIVRGKGDKTRQVPVLPKVQALLSRSLVTAAARPDRRLVPLSDRGARATWTRLGLRAGLDRATASHDGRMTFGTTVYAKSNDLRATQELLGHASSATTEGYTGISEATKREAANIL